MCKFRTIFCVKIALLINLKRFQFPLSFLETRLLSRTMSSPSGNMLSYYNAVVSMLSVFKFFKKSLQLIDINSAILTRDNRVQINQNIDPFLPSQVITGNRGYSFIFTQLASIYGYIWGKILVINCLFCPEKSFQACRFTRDPYMDQSILH